MKWRNKETLPPTLRLLTSGLSATPNRCISDFALLVQIPTRNFGYARNVIRHIIA